jgi:hypothetical protein
MNIPETAKKLKGLLEGELFILLILVLSSGISFSLGYLAAKDTLKQSVVIDSSNVEGIAQIGDIEQNYVAAISGTKYYLPNCSGVSRIKEENKVWFSAKEDAELAGYGPAANCEGI